MSGLKVPVAALDARTENKRSEVTELRTLLRSLEVQRDPKSYLQVVQKVIAYMTLGIDVSKLFSEMIMKDCRDRNPVVRGLALRSMCSLRIPNIVEYLRDPLQAGLVDRSGYVRKTAVLGVVKLFYVASRELNLVDILYQMLRDKDVQVVSNCISALNEILAFRGRDGHERQDCTLPSSTGDGAGVEDTNQPVRKVIDILYNEPPYVKSKKLELLTELCNMENAFQIVEELGGYATDVNVLVAQKAVQAICNIALRLTGRADLCVDKLLSLFAMEMDYVTAEALVAMTNILRQFENMVEVILPRLPSSLDLVPTHLAKLHLSGYLETVKLQLLTATMKLFFKRPPECQAMLGRLLEHAIVNVTYQWTEEARPKFF
eukprot:Em0015g956a